MFLVDTNVISVGSPSVRAAPADLVEWLKRSTERLYLSVVTIAEIEDGIAKEKRRGASRKAAALEAWLEMLLHVYGGRFFDVDMEIARATGRMADLARSSGRAPDLADLIIAATASMHGLIILTRNVKDFEDLGVTIVNPFDRLPNGGGLEAI